MFYRRKDAKLIDKQIPVFNRMFPYMMKNRNESLITLKEPLILTKTLKFINERRDSNGKRLYSYFDLLIAGAMRTIAMYPQMNRFIMGGHYYQRNELSCAFVIKTKLTMDDPERNIIIRCNPEDTLAIISKRMRDAVKEGQTVDNDDQEKTISTLFKLPSFMIQFITSALMKFDKWGILPLSVTEMDALHTSVFLANLGSIGLNDAPAHHLFEWGTCSLFITSGRIKKQHIVDRMGHSTVEDVMNVCFSIDERISEGFYYAQVIKMLRKLLENPHLLEEVPDLSKTF